jgi:hypothetical protein
MQKNISELIEILLNAFSFSLKFFKNNALSGKPKKKSMDKLLRVR